MYPMLVLFQFTSTQIYWYLYRPTILVSELPVRLFFRKYRNNHIHFEYCSWELISLWKESLNSDGQKIPPISTKCTITSHLLSLYVKKIPQNMTLEIQNPGFVLIQNRADVELVNRIPTLPSWLLELQWQNSYKQMIKNPAHISLKLY